MAKARQDKPRKLKVFQAQFGFYDSVVAAPSQAAALRAWGASQNLFKDGDAHPTDDEQAIEAATSHPEVPLRRAVGSNEPFSLDPRLPRLQDLPDVAAELTRRKASKPLSNANSVEVKSARAKPPPNRSAMEAAEAALRALESARKSEEQEFEERRAALDPDERTAKSRYEDARSQALKTLRREQQAYAKAGGRIDRPR